MDTIANMPAVVFESLTQPLRSSSVLLTYGSTAWIPVARWWNWSSRPPAMRSSGSTMATSSSTVAFRVYRGLLAAQSEVFAGMFAGSSSQDAESYHGCPIVQLSDSPQDLRHLLRVLLPTTKPV